MISGKIFTKYLIRYAAIIMIFGFIFFPNPLLKAAPMDKEKSVSPESMDISRMSIEDKAGQVLFLAISGPTLDESVEQILKDLRPGGIILYANVGNIESPEQVKTLTQNLQKRALELGLARLFIGIDQEGGLINRITEGVTVFPGNMALGATREISLAENQGRAMAEELAALGINWDFVPCLDVLTTPDNLAIGTRSFGGDPLKVADLGAAMIKGFEAGGVITSAKHFPGHGSTLLDSHEDMPLLEKTLPELEKMELLPFLKAAKTGVPTVMTAHIRASALDDSPLPTTFSDKTIDFLREKLNFKGAIVTDSLGMGAVTKRFNPGETAVRALLAGVDILLFGADRNFSLDQFPSVHKAIIKAVAEGRLPAERLDDAVKKILALKQKYLYQNMPREPSLYGSPKNIALAEEIAAKGITVIRQPKISWPPFGAMEKTKKVVFIWPDKHRKAIEPFWEKVAEHRIIFLPENLSAAYIQEITADLQGVEQIIIGTYNLHLAGKESWRELIEKLGPKRVCVVAARIPFDPAMIPDLDGYIATYGDTQASIKALFDLLAGKIKAVGQLPLSF